VKWELLAPTYRLKAPKSSVSAFHHWLTHGLRGFAQIGDDLPVPHGREATWESHMGNPEIHGKSMGNPWEIHGKSMGNPANTGI